MRAHPQHEHQLLRRLPVQEGRVAEGRRVQAPGPAVGAAAALPGDSPAVCRGPAGPAARGRLA
eukprot:2000622-Pyramimonas_sp.AAC.1